MLFVNVSASKISTPTNHGFHDNDAGGTYELALGSHFQAQNPLHCLSSNVILFMIQRADQTTGLD